MELEQQVERIKRDIHCHWQELSALTSLKETKEDPRLDRDIDKIKKLIKAKQDLVRTMALDYKIGVV